MLKQSRSIFTFSATLLLLTVFSSIGAPAKANDLKLGREWLAKALKEIESSSKLSEIKTIYFNPRIPHELPIQNGLKIIDTAYLTEPVETKRWFALANARCYGNFRFQYSPKEDSLKDYAALFAKAADAPKADAGRILRISITDFIRLIVSQTRRSDIEEFDMAPPLGAAWNAYVITESYGEKWGQQIRWIPLLEYLYFPKEVMDFADEKIEDAQVPNTFAVRAPLALAYAMRHHNGDKSIEHLLAAKALVPLKADGRLDESQIDAEDVEIFYEEIISVFHGQRGKRGEEVMQLAEEELKLLGTNGGRLVDYYFEYLDDNGVERPKVDLETPREEKLVAALSNKRVKSGPILEVAEALYRGGFFEEYNWLQSNSRVKLARRLAQWIIENPQTYNAWDVVEARLLIGSTYRAQQNEGPMRKSLTFEWPTPKGQDELRELKKLQARRAFLLKPHALFRGRTGEKFFLK